MTDPLAGRLEEVAVVRGVVGRNTASPMKSREHGTATDSRGVWTIRPVIPVSTVMMGDRLFRIDEGTKLPGDLAGAPDLIVIPAVGGTAAGRRGPPQKVVSAKRCTVEVEVELGEVRQWDGGHVFDAMRWRRQNRSAARR